MRGPLYSLQDLPTGKVSIMARPRGGDWLADEMKMLRISGVDILVSLLTPLEESEFDLGEESACCRAQDILYLSLPIIDRSVPPFSQQTFQILQQLSTSLSEGRHIAFHCRQGLGRAALMAASLLVLASFIPQQAFDLLSQVRGYVVPETEEQKAWVMAFFHRQQSA